MVRAYVAGMPHFQITEPWGGNGPSCNGVAEQPTPPPQAAQGEAERAVETVLELAEKWADGKRRDRETFDEAASLVRILARDAKALREVLENALEWANRQGIIPVPSWVASARALLHPTPTGERAGVTHMRAFFGSRAACGADAEGTAETHTEATCERCHNLYPDQSAAPAEVALREALEARVMQLERAIEWACGAKADPDGRWFEPTEFSPSERGRRPYWWRRHLRKLTASPRALLRGDGKGG